MSKLYSNKNLFWFLLLAFLSIPLISYLESSSKLSIVVERFQPQVQDIENVKRQTHQTLAPHLPANWAKVLVNNPTDQTAPIYFLLPRGFSRDLVIYQAPDYLPHNLSMSKDLSESTKTLVSTGFQLNKLSASGTPFYLRAKDGQLPVYMEVYDEKEFFELSEVASNLFIGQRLLMFTTFCFALFLWF